jgi:replicative DNA helicase
MTIEIQEGTITDEQQQQRHVFGPHEEVAIISLAFDQPEFFSAVIGYLRDDHFDRYETKFIFNIIKFYHDKHNLVITRPMCIDIAEQTLTADDPHDEVLSLIKRESDPREIPIITERLIEWARRKQYSLLYSKDALDAHERGEYQYQEQVIEDARKIVNFGTDLLWMFDDYEQLFVEDKEEKLTTGFASLDSCLNYGGPTRRDTLCYLAPTGVGKSITLNHTGIANIRRRKNVLHVTCEMPKLQVGYRYLGGFTELRIRDRLTHKLRIIDCLRAVKATYGAELILAEYPPDEISVDTVHALLDVLRRVHGIIMDVVIIDYLELMIPRKASGREDEYLRQKRVSTEFARLAVKENVFGVTASQSNRSGMDPLNTKGGDNVIELNKMAESFGKAMPLSYVVTINQTKQEYESGREIIQGDTKEQIQERPVTSARCRLYIAKNRNGPKFKSIGSTINYETMVMREQGFIDTIVRPDNEAINKDREKSKKRK